MPRLYDDRVPILDSENNRFSYARIPKKSSLHQPVKRFVPDHVIKTCEPYITVTVCEDWAFYCEDYC